MLNVRAFDTIFNVIRGKSPAYRAYITVVERRFRLRTNQGQFSASPKTTGKMYVKSYFCHASYACDTVTNKFQSRFSCVCIIFLITLSLYCRLCSFYGFQLASSCYTQKTYIIFKISPDFVRTIQPSKCTWIDRLDRLFFRPLSYLLFFQCHSDLAPPASDKKMCLVFFGPRFGTV